MADDKLPWLRKVRATLIAKSGGRTVATQEKQIQELGLDEQEAELRRLQREMAAKKKNEVKQTMGGKP